MKPPPCHNPPQFRFSAPWREAEAFVALPLIPGSQIVVTGSPDGGTCDWTILTGIRVQASSDEGFGSCARALLDGLERAKYLGLL